jgi:hypothetical protein
VRTLNPTRSKGLRIEPTLEDAEQWGKCETGGCLVSSWKTLLPV